MSFQVVLQRKRTLTDVAFVRSHTRVSQHVSFKVPFTSRSVLTVRTREHFLAINVGDNTAIHSPVLQGVTVVMVVVVADIVVTGSCITRVVIA